MKDEFKGKTISKFVVDGGENKKSKGVNRSVVSGIRYKKFVAVLFNKG